METTPASEVHTPETLMEAVQHFSDEDTCHEYVCAIKWPDGQVCCPDCGSVAVGRISSRRMFQCREKGCRKQFSVKVGTIFEDSPLALSKWLVAVWCIVNAKNGISSCELARAIGVTQKTAWHMLHRIRLAMQTKTFQRITGEVESDEVFIGGRAINMHRKQRQAKMAGFGHKGKTAVHGMLERGGEIRARVIPRANKKNIQLGVRENVEPGSHLYTDISGVYKSLGDEYIHRFVNHALRYVEGRVHTNGLENFWSLLKRCLKGTYVAVEPQHLDRYLDEQCRRFNMRKGTDGDRFRYVMADIVGKQLTYKALIGSIGRTK